MEGEAKKHEYIAVKNNVLSILYEIKLLVNLKDRFRGF